LSRSGSITVSVEATRAVTLEIRTVTLSATRFAPEKQMVASRQRPSHLRFRAWRPDTGGRTGDPDGNDPTETATPENRAWTVCRQLSRRKIRRVITRYRSSLRYIEPRPLFHSRQTRDAARYVPQTMRTPEQRTTHNTREVVKPERQSGVASRTTLLGERSRTKDTAGNTEPRG